MQPPKAQVVLRVASGESSLAPAATVNAQLLQAGVARLRLPKEVGPAPQIQVHALGHCPRFRGLLALGLLRAQAGMARGHDILGFALRMRAQGSVLRVKRVKV